MPAGNDRVCRCPSWTVTSGAGASAENSKSAIPLPVKALVEVRCCTDLNTRSGLVRHTTPAHTHGVEHRCGPQDLRHDGAHPREGASSPAAPAGRRCDTRRPRPASPALDQGRVHGHLAQGGVERAGEEPEVRRRAGRAPHLGQGMQEAPLEVLSECRLPRGAAGLLKPDRGCRDRPVCTSLGSELDAGGCADQD